MAVETVGWVATSPAYHASLRRSLLVWPNPFLCFLQLFAQPGDEGVVWVWWVGIVVGVGGDLVSVLAAGKRQRRPRGRSA